MDKDNHQNVLQLPYSYIFQEASLCARTSRGRLLCKYLRNKWNANSANFSALIHLIFQVLSRSLLCHTGVYDFLEVLSLSGKQFPGSSNLNESGCYSSMEIFCIVFWKMKMCIVKIHNKMAENFFL
jgi:hypothetical protein